MRLLIGSVMSLALALGVAPAAATTTAAPPDPAVVAALEAAARTSYITAWRERGGTFVSRCADPAQGDSVSITELDVKHRTKRNTWRLEGSLPTIWISRGRARYTKSPAAVRRSLRVHRAPVPAKWVKRRDSVVVPGRADDLWGSQDGPLVADASWAELTSVPLPDGGVRFTGTTTPGGWTTEHEYVTSATAVTDATGRLVRIEQRTDRRTHAGAVLSSTSCVTTWNWARPNLAIPKNARPNRHPGRYTWERVAVEDTKRLTWRANERLAAGASKADVVAWLHTRVGARNQLPNGVRLVKVSRKKRTSRPPIAFKVLVRDGQATYRPVR